jgi:hypothetical protein
MTRRTVAMLAAVLAALAGTSTARAQTLPVQAGEHVGFTRVVLRIGEGRQWQLDDMDGGMRLLLSPGVDGFDLSESFDLIQRTRIADLRAEGGDLSILLACDCAVSSFRYLDRFLVIDIADRAAAPVPPAERPAAPDTPARAEDEARARQRADAAAALPDLSRVLTGGPSVLSPGVIAPAPAAPQATSSRPSADVIELEEATRIMAEQLARAAAAGLLTPASDTPVGFADPLTDRAAEPDPADAPSVTSRAPNLPAPTPPSETARSNLAPAPADSAETLRRTAPDLPLRAQTALDRAVGAGPDPLAPTPPLACTGAAMGLASWSAGDDFASGLGPLRRTLFDDRDRLVDAAARDLARHYLSHGFGAEARFLLMRMAAPPRDLLSLAALVDGRSDAPYSDIADSTACSDEEFLLRYIAGAAGSRPSRDEANRVQRGLATLPAPLQVRLGPDLARRLAADGHPAAARNIRDALERSGRLPDAAILSLDLDIGVEVEPALARQTLAAALRDNGATPAPVMAQSLTLDRTEGRIADPARVTAAEGLMRETPPGPEADALWREVVAARARMGQVDAAIAMLTTGRSTHPGIWQATMTDILADRVEQDDGAALLLLAHLFGADWTDGGSRAGRVRVATARHLRAANLDAAAEIIAANGPGLILPDPGPPPRQDSGQATLWTAGDWVEIARTVDGPHGALATRMARRAALPEQPAADEAGIDLDRLAAQVEDSAVLRDTIGAVLTTRVGDRTP